MNRVNDLDENNLIMFPASKNYFPVNDEFELGIPSFLDERFDNDKVEIENDQVFGSLEAYMNRTNLVVNPSDDKLIQKIDEQMAAIKITKERIKFYLDEIDIFMPKRK